MSQAEQLSYLEILDQLAAGDFAEYPVSEERCTIDLVICPK